MEIRAGQVVVHYVEHGTGRPVRVLHGAGVEHREAEACFELFSRVLRGCGGSILISLEWSGQLLPKRCAARRGRSRRWPEP
jgi:hypothetical protein